MHPASQTQTQIMKTRTASVPAYYLGRPASFWITVTTRRAGTPDLCR